MRVVTATRHPEWMATKKGYQQHRVRELHIIFQDGEAPRARAEWECGNGGGSWKSPLTDRPDLPKCPKCEQRIRP